MANNEVPLDRIVSAKTVKRECKACVRRIPPEMSSDPHPLRAAAEYEPGWS